jgi:hypothetical protein
MTPDESYSLLLVTFLVVTITQKQFSAMFLELLLTLSRPGATILLLGLMAWVYNRGLHYTFLALAILSVFILKDVWSGWVQSDARRLYLEMGRDQDRFDPATSIDLQFANGSVTHFAPKMYGNDNAPSPLLIFPPSAGTQLEMNGP